MDALIDNNIRSDPHPASLSCESFTISYQMAGIIILLIFMVLRNVGERRCNKRISKLDTVKSLT